MPSFRFLILPAEPSLVHCHASRTLNVFFGLADVKLQAALASLIYADTVLDEHSMQAPQSLVHFASLALQDSEEQPSEASRQISPKK